MKKTDTKTLTTQIANDEKLKSCPFCGTVPSVTETIYGNYFVMCFNSNCLMYVHTAKYYTTPSEAITTWNKRTDNGEIINEKT